MLSNAYFLAKFRFDTAENEPAKILQNFRKLHFSKMHFGTPCPEPTFLKSSRSRCWTLAAATVAVARAVEAPVDFRTVVGLVALMFGVAAYIFGTHFTSAGPVSEYARRYVNVCCCFFVGCASGQILQGAFSGVSKPNFASKYAFESSCRDLHNALF